MGKKSKAKKARRAQGGKAGKGGDAGLSGDSQADPRSAAEAPGGAAKQKSSTAADVTVTVRGPDDPGARESKAKQNKAIETSVSVSAPGGAAASAAASKPAAKPAPKPAPAATATPSSSAAPPSSPTASPKPASPAKTPPSGGAGQRPPSPAGGRSVGLLQAILGVLGVGIGIATFLVRTKLKIDLDPTYQSSCNYGGSLNCDAVNVSAYSEIFGIPISLIAIPTYLVMGYLVWLAIQGRRTGLGTVRDRGEVALQAVATIGLLTVGYSVFLAFVSSVWIKAYCVYCISLYAVNLVVTGLALAAGAGSPVTAVTGAMRALFGFRAPVPAALGVVAVTAALALGGYSTAKGSMEEAYKRRIDEQMAETVTPAASSTGAEQAAPTQTAAATNVSAKSPPPAPGPVLQSTEKGSRGGKKTDDGWTYFAPPLDDQTEFWYGPADADVTVVKYADFQCAYCRRLADSFEKVHETYGDRVRFVMKHFPMNIKCNRAMKGFDKHPVACEASYTAHCAGEQGKFWEMHDLLYENQSSISLDTLRGYAEQLELDMAAYDACYASPATAEKIGFDVETGLYAGIYGTPRTYINNRLVTGSATAPILEYYIDKALAEAAGKSGGGERADAAPKPDGTSMIEIAGADGGFFIDPYEAAITTDGRAVSQPDLAPAHADYYSATDACKKAGKRLCTEQEWVSACAGAPAVDNNNNRMFADDQVEGDMYPYGAYHEDGFCNDRADERSGRAAKTGSFGQCRTAAGVHDMGGNIAEWADAANDKPTLLGGNMSSATGAACNRRTFSTPPGSRNRTTGFRCCADGNVEVALVEKSAIEANLESVLNMPVPNFESKDTAGNEVSSTEFRGQVTLVNFFASWCGPCKKEFPYLVDYADKYKEQGLSIVGVGVDSVATRSEDFAKGFEVNFPVVTDPEAKLKGKFLVYEMPATFIVDREGVVRYSATGFSGEDQEAELRSAIEKLL